MGQKVNPCSIRLGTKATSGNFPTSSWASTWLEKSSQNKYSSLVYQDLLIQSYLRKIYSNLGFSLQNSEIKRDYFRTRLELNITKIDSSRKVKRNLRFLNKSKLVNSLYVILKERKFQQRHILLQEDTLKKVPIHSDDVFTQHFGRSHLNRQKAWVMKLAYGMKRQKVQAGSVSWFQNKVNPNLSQAFQHLKRRESQVELKSLFEIRQTLQHYLKLNSEALAKKQHKDFSAYFFLGSQLKIKEKAKRNFISHLNNRSYSRNYNKFDIFRYKFFNGTLPLYFTLFKAPGLANLIPVVKREPFISQTIERIKHKELFPTNEFDQVNCSISNYNLRSCNLDNHLNNSQLGFCLSWRNSDQFKNQAVLFKETLGANVLSDFIAAELTKPRHSRHLIFKGPLKKAFSQIWINYTYSQQKRKFELPLGIKIQCKGRWEGKERKGTVVYETGSIPLSSIKTRIDYSSTRFTNKYGSSNIKVWIAWNDVSFVRQRPKIPFTQHLQKRRFGFFSLYFKKLRIRFKLNKKYYFNYFM